MGPREGQVNGPCRRAGVNTLAWVTLLVFLPGPALAALPNPTAQSFEAGRLVVLSALAAGAVALAIAAALWALAEQRTARRLARAVRANAAHARAAMSERDALLNAAREPMVVWAREGGAPLSYGGGLTLLESCLKGADAAALAAALADLKERGAAFQMSVLEADGKERVARGRAVGGMAVLWLEEMRAAAAESGEFRAILDALPVPVWLRDKALALSWANHAFLKSTGIKDLSVALAAQAAIDKSERDLAASARSQNLPVAAKRFAVVEGQRRAMQFSEIPLGDAGIIGVAVDVSEVAAAEAKLQQHVDAHADTLDKLKTAVAIFAPDQKLTFYNRAFAELWGLQESWLDKHPGDGEILDRLREARKLPEQRDFQAWKRQRLALYQTGREHTHEELWHLPSGQTLRVVTQPHPFGGLTFLYEDVSEKLALESNYNTLIKVQSATLDNMVEGVGVFGPDGKLKLYNAAFARIWDLSADELAEEPHVRSLAALCQDRFGNGEIWERLIQAIVSGAGRDLGEMERGDHTILKVGVAALPDGATLTTFADVTDRLRVENALRDRNEALEAADRLKSDFIKHVSYELRTPLNTILGFSEHLASGVPGALNPRQEEYVQAIVSGSHSLKDLVNDILDLALIESGALRLELERIDLYGLLADVANHAGEWASKTGLELELDCAPGAGLFLADQRRMRQIVFNLLSNAFKFTARGGRVVLSGRIVGEDVQISVADNGPGLAPDVKATVFERFSARGQSGQRAGAGLGLALVNRFIELHDGWVEIESGPKDKIGTLVRCHVPRRIRDNDRGDDRIAFA